MQIERAHQPMTNAKAPHGRLRVVVCEYLDDGERQFGSVNTTAPWWVAIEGWRRRRAHLQRFSGGAGVASGNLVFWQGELSWMRTIT
jgi:hypothetical protein